MWSEVLKRIDELKEINCDCVGMGAETHRYQFGPRLTEKQIKKHESRLGTTLPDDLRTLYSNCGNGGCGPDWGIRPIHELVAYKPDQDFPGLDYFNGQSGFDPIPTGMIGFMERYYAHEACIVTNGVYKGCVLEYIPDADCVYVGAKDLPTLYHNWLDDCLETFNLLKRKIIVNPDINTILLNFPDRGGAVYSIPMIASLLRLDIDKSAKGWHFKKSKKEIHSDRTVTWSLDSDVANTINAGIKAFVADENRRTLSFKYQRFTRMNFLAIDVHYRNNTGYVAGITFTDRGGKNNGRIYKTVVEGIEDYVSGQFYKRELPCIQALLNEHKLLPDCIIIDGFVHLEGDKPGLGKHLFDSLNGTTPVIGVAKNPMGAVDKKYEVFRGISARPLFVTTEGIELELAKNIVMHLKGAHRIPDYLREVDASCRKM